MPPVGIPGIAPDGSITIADPAAPDQPPAEIGRIKLAAWEGSPISKGLDGLFRVEGGGILPTDEAATVKVGSLEQSNVKTTEVLVDMIDAQRLFAMRSKVISTAREIDESGADKLIINGSLTIDQGTTLQLEPTGTVRPGQSYDLILASGGITGQYSKIVKPDSLFGFVVQRADRIQLLGEFRGDARFSPQVARAIAYTNGLLARPVATSGFYDVVPLLAREDGSSDAQGFAALTPEAYASATQAGVEDALTVADTARGPAFGTQREAPGFFTFAQSVGQWRTLGADRQQGTAQAHMRGYGFLGGVGYGDATFSVGGFAGYVNMRQEIDGIEAQTKNDEFVAGIHARYAENGIGLAASFLYDGGKARTTRVVAGRNPVEGRYDLHSWVADLSGRSYLVFSPAFQDASVGDLPVALVTEFFRAVVDHGRLNLHIDLLRVANDHHGVEAIFKAFGRALDRASRRRVGVSGIPSTKGQL